MANYNKGLNTLGDPNGYSTQNMFSATSSLSAQIDALNRLRSEEKEFEGELNRLKISNFEFLRRAQLSQVEQLTNAYMTQYSILLDQQLKNAEELKKEEIKSLYERNEITKDEAEKRWEEEKNKIRELADWRLRQEREANRSLIIDEEKRRKKEKKDKEKANKEELAQLTKLYSFKNKPKTKAEKEAIKEAEEALYEQRKIVDDDGIERYETEEEAATRAEKTIKKAKLDSVMSSVKGILEMMDSTMEQIASYKTNIDTRLQGSKNKTSYGSYWDAMSSNITSFAGASVLVKQSKIAERVASMVEQGIAFNVEQRASLQELAGKIATTFDATNGTLLRLVRIQQQDTTAGRLGMESALTAFLNNMYETSEYMSQIANSVKSNIEEAMAMMSGEAAVSFEYQVQK